MLYKAWADPEEGHPGKSHVLQVSIEISIRTPFEKSGPSLKLLVPQGPIVYPSMKHWETLKEDPLSVK